MTEACSVDVCGARGAAQELAVARVAEQQGDIPHAAFHVAAALFEDPLSLEAKTMALRLDDAQSGVFQPDGFAGTLAAAAVVAFARGKVEQALSWTAQLAEALPDLPWHVWLAEQVSRAIATNTPIPVDVARLAIVLGKHTIGVLHLRPGEQRAFARYADALFGAAAAPNADGFLCGGLSALCRRAGQYERAVSLAQRAHERSPGEALPLIMLGLALRAVGRTDDAADAFRRASDVEGRSDGYRTERARCFVDVQRFQEAFDLLEQEPDKERDFEVRLLRATCVHNGARLPRLPRAKPGLLQRLFKHSEDNPNAAAEATEASLLELAGHIAFAGPRIDSDVIRRLALGHGRWFGVGEATVNLVQQVPPGSGLRSVTLSSLEAPSSQLALALHCGLSDMRELNVSVQSIPTPDPRAVDDDGLALWRFDEHVPAPAVPPPSPDVLAEIVAIAGVHEPLWWPALLQRATTMRAINVDEVMACMVHPGPPAAGVDVVRHVAFVQLAAAAVLSRLEPGRAVLLRLLGGPVDWVTVAAATALVEACCEGVVDPNVVGPRLRRLVERIPEQGHCCLTEPLLLLLPRVPFARGEVVARLEALTSDDSDQRASDDGDRGEVV